MPDPLAVDSVIVTIVVAMEGGVQAKHSVAMERADALELARLHRLGTDGFWRLPSVASCDTVAVWLPDIRSVWWPQLES